jgi:GST-like protein
MITSPYKKKSDLSICTEPVLDSPIQPLVLSRVTFRKYAPEKIDYVVNRYTNETKRLYGAMDKQLAKSKFMACNHFTVAGIAIFPWLRSREDQDIDWADYPHLKAWFDLVGARPAARRGVEVLAELRKPIRDDKEREILSGSSQYQRR